MIRMEGRVLLFDEVNSLSSITPKNCKLTVPEKIPLTWRFAHSKPIGFVTPVVDDKGIYGTAEIFYNDYITGIKFFQDIMVDGKIGVGGYYKVDKVHTFGDTHIVDEATLLEVALTPSPVNEEYYFKFEDETEV